MESSEPQPPTEEAASSSGQTLPLDGYISNPFSVFLKSLQQLFAVNLKTLGVFILWFIGTVIIAIVLIGLSVAIGERIGMVVVGLVAAALLVVLQVAYTKYLIETARGQSISARACLRVGRRKALGFAGLGLLLSLTLLVGSILFVIPGLIFLYWFILSPFVYVDEDVGIIEAMKTSKSYSQGNAAELFGYYGAGVVLSLLSVLPIVGAIYSLMLSPVAGVANGYRYVSFKAVKTGQLTKPQVNSANYVAIFLIPVALILMVVLGGVFGEQQPARPEPQDFIQSESGFDSKVMLSLPQLFEVSLINHGLY